MRNSVLVVATFAALSQAHANTTFTFKKAHIIKNYVSTYQHIATFESVRSGIPTSIILAQGIIESQCGSSYLAMHANNHFGIKWKSDQDGRYVTMNDDERDNRGNMIASKFVVYNSVEESYRMHSDFLMKRERYKRLFSFDRTDYRNWAKGLSECSYATDPNYAQKLINCIEQYELFQYDISEDALSLDDEETTSPNNYVSNPTIYTQSEVNDREEYTSNTKPIQAKVSDIRDSNESALFEITGLTVYKDPSAETWEVKNPKPVQKENQLYEITPITKSKETAKKPVSKPIKKNTNKKKK